MKHSYICYAAVSEDGESIFQRDSARDEDSGELGEWFNEWVFDPEIVAECGFMCRNHLERYLKEANCPAKIKKFRITVEQLPTND